MSGATTLLPSDPSTLSTITRITDLRRLRLIRASWLALTVFQLVILGIVLSLVWNATDIPEQAATMVEATGMSLTTFKVYNTLSGLIGTIVYFVPSYILMWRSGNERTALLFSFLFLPFLAANFGYETDSALLKFDGILFVGALYGWVYLFPTGTFFPGWMKYLFVLAIIVSAVGIFQDLQLPLQPIAFLIGIGAMIYRYRRSNAIQRQQMKWLLLVFVMVALLIPFNILLTQLPTSSLIHGYLLILLQIAFAIGVSVWPFAVLFAIMRYGLWNIDLVINRSLVYGIVTVLLLGVFTASVFAIQAILDTERSLISFLVSAVGPILLFRPTLKRSQHIIDRYLYRLNFDLNELAHAQKRPAISNPGALTGKTLSGYEVRDVIGQGGMGEVYLGMGNGQIVAVKTMLPKIAQDPNMQIRFQREAQAGMELVHPHIAKVFAYGEIERTPYLVMEYIEGDDLSHILKNEGHLDEETASQMMQDICSALDTAHSKGFIHRDLKPSNIMIQPNGSAVLMDFGVTKVTDASTGLTGTGAIGTIDYMAPEQIAAAREVDKRADIYALGIMLFEMLTGEKPFKGSAAQILFGHLQQPPDDPRDLQPDIPRHMADAVKKSLAKDPGDRFQSAGALAQALYRDSTF